MKARQLVSIVLKILGVYAFIRFVTLAPMVILGFRVAESGAYVGWYYGVTALAYLICGVCLLVFSDRLAKAIAKDGDELPTASGPVSESFSALAFQCLGIYVLIRGISDLAGGLVYLTRGSGLFPDTALWAQDVVVPVIKVLLGFLLLFGARGLVRFVRKARQKALGETDEKKPGADLPPPV
jgi:hypothetical protein